MKILAQLGYWLVAVGSMVFGLLGVFAPEFEKELLYKLALEPLRLADSNGLAVLLSEQRAAAALQVGFGALLVVVRRQVFEERRVNAIFLATLMLLPLSRLVSLFLDGLPNAMAVLVLVLEALVAAFFAVYFGGALWSRAARAAASSATTPAEGVPMAALEPTEPGEPS